MPGVGHDPALGRPLLGRGQHHAAPQRTARVARRVETGTRRGALDDSRHRLRPECARAQSTMAVDRSVRGTTLQHSTPPPTHSTLAPRTAGRQNRVVPRRRPVRPAPRVRHARSARRRHRARRSRPAEDPRRSRAAGASDRASPRDRPGAHPTRREAPPRPAARSDGGRRADATRRARRPPARRRRRSATVDPGRRGGRGSPRADAGPSRPGDGRPRRRRTQRRWHPTPASHAPIARDTTPRTRPSRGRTRARSSEHAVRKDAVRGYRQLGARTHASPGVR